MSIVRDGRKLKYKEVALLKEELIAEDPICPITGADLSKIPPGKLAVDHCHLSGKIRGVLPMGINRAEGIINKACVTWGRTGKDYKKVVAFLRKLCDYLEREPIDLIHPTHDKPKPKRKTKK